MFCQGNGCSQSRLAARAIDNNNRESGEKMRADRIKGTIRRQDNPQYFGLRSLIRFFAFGGLLSLTSLADAAEEKRTVAIVPDGMDIPIVIMSPDSGNGPFPMIYHVHGGGWNGGTETEVPDAGLPPDAPLLCDHLGIIYVGLAYRCKDQRGTFALAIDDLKASIKWFESRADRFQADLTRVGFSGGSAGTPLSSVLAQQASSCRTYLGLFGVYNLLYDKRSLFSDQEALERYGLVTEEQKREASAFHQLRDVPPASLLFHGGKDVFTHSSQSVEFAEAIRASGGDAESIAFPNVNHGYFNPRYPKEFRTTCLEIAQLYSKHFELKNYDLAKLNLKIDQSVARFLPLDTVDSIKLSGSWRGKRETYRFAPGGTGTVTNNQGESNAFTYQMEIGFAEITLENLKT
jgi:acetyl esterase/lipase